MTICILSGVVLIAGLLSVIRLMKRLTSLLHLFYSHSSIEEEELQTKFFDLVEADQ